MFYMRLSNIWFFLSLTLCVLNPKQVPKLWMISLLHFPQPQTTCACVKSEAHTHTRTHMHAECCILSFKDVQLITVCKYASSLCACLLLCRITLASEIIFSLDSWLGFGSTIRPYLFHLFCSEGPCQSSQISTLLCFAWSHLSPDPLPHKPILCDNFLSPHYFWNQHFLSFFEDWHLQ